MYEIVNGTKRLARALEIAATSPTNRAALAHYLNYCTAEQLDEDIRAMADYLHEAERLRRLADDI